MVRGGEGARAQVMTVAGVSGRQAAIIHGVQEAEENVEPLGRERLVGRNLEHVDGTVQEAEAVESGRSSCSASVGRWWDEDLNRPRKGEGRWHQKAAGVHHPQQARTGRARLPRLV